jgi:hypothetical protein
LPLPVPDYPTVFGRTLEEGRHLLAPLIERWYLGQASDNTERVCAATAWPPHKSRSSRFRMAPFGQNCRKQDEAS